MNVLMVNYIEFLLLLLRQSVIAMMIETRAMQEIMMGTIKAGSVNTSSGDGPRLPGDPSIPPPIGPIPSCRRSGSERENS